MDQFPHVAYVGVHEGRTVFGSFVDSEWVLHFVAAGEWSFQMEGRDYLVGPGDMILLPPRLLHVVRQVSGKQRAQHVIHFALHGSTLGQKLPLAVSLPKRQQGEATRLFKRLRREWLAAEPFVDVITGGILAEMLGLYFRNSERPKSSAASATLAWKNIECSVQFLHANFHRPDLTLRDISAAAKVSPNYLCRLFKQNTGYTPMAYLTLLRHSKAEELLLRSLQNCTEIAEAAGYGDLHVFSRSFKKIAGLSPTEFQKQHARRAPTA